MRWVACLLFAGCGLTLDLTPPEEDGGAFDASRDAGRGDASADAGVDGSLDGNVADVLVRDVMIDAVFRPDSDAECSGDLDCATSDCTRWGCVDGLCVALGPIACEPLVDACHEYTGFCTDDRCDQDLIDFDGDGEAPIELGTCGTDCDDDDPFEAEGIVCGEDFDDDGFGSKDAFFPLCGADVACPEGYVEDISDCWDDIPDGFDPGPGDANPDANERFFGQQRGNGTFDWNCDGMITTNNGRRLFMGCGGFDSPPGSCQMQSGWTSRIPDCGEIEDFTSCVAGMGGRCMMILSPERIQLCR